ncbi:MAG: PilW family protein [Porticoccaceae bacterium]
MIELLIAASIGLLLVSFIHNIASKTLWIVKEVEASAEVLESAQYLTGLLSREIGLAGFFGDFNTANLPSSGAPDLCQHMGRAQVIKAMPYPVAGIDNVVSGYKLCGRDIVLSGTDVMLLRRSAIDQKSPRYKLQSQQIYIQGSFADPNPIIDRGDNSAAFILMQGANRKPVRAWQQTLYYVSNDNIFKRRRFLKGRYLNSEPLVDGVQDFQVEYVVRKLDVTSNCGEEYLSAPLTDAQWKRVVALRVHFLLRSSWQGQSQEGKQLNYANKTYDIRGDGYYELFKVLMPIMNKL